MYLSKSLRKISKSAVSERDLFVDIFQSNEKHSKYALAGNGYVRTMLLRQKTFISIKKLCFVPNDNFMHNTALNLNSGKQFLSLRLSQ